MSYRNKYLEESRSVQKWSNRTLYVLLPMMALLFLFHFFKILKEEMGGIGFLYLGIIASLFYIIPKVAMPKEKIIKKKRKKRKK